MSVGVWNKRLEFVEVCLDAVLEPLEMDDGFEIARTRFLATLNW